LTGTENFDTLLGSSSVDEPDVVPQHDLEPASCWQEVTLHFSLKIPSHFPNGNSSLFFLVKEETVERLLERCFRGRDVRRAGNFSAWENVVQLFDHSIVRDEFLRDVLKSFEEMKRTQKPVCYSANIDVGEEIGWESTAYSLL
jgi:hypothetical protein